MASIRNIRINLPDDLVKEVDTFVSNENINRDDFICEATNVYIVQRKRSSIIAQMKRGYTEMASINLTLAMEGRYFEEDTIHFFDMPKFKGE